MPVLLGGDIAIYSLARNFHECYGSTSIVIAQAKNGITSYSSFIDSRIEPNMEKLDVFLDTLRGISGEFPGKKLILMASGDWYVRMVIENRDSLGQNYVVPYIAEGLLDRLVLKDSFYDICQELGIPYPKTFVYDPAAPVDLDLPFDYPVIAKPANSALYHFADFPGKRKVFRFDNEAQLRTMLGNLARSSYDYKFLIQEFIPGDDTNMRILTCYADRDSKVQLAAFGRVLLEDHGPQAIGNPVAIINDRNDEIVEYASRLLEHVGYTGFANFDLKYDPRDGSLRFFEINTRLGRSNYYVAAGGANPVSWIVDELILGKELTYTVASDKRLYSVVPRSVLRDYVKDPVKAAEIDKLYETKQVVDPLNYPGDKSLVHRLYYWLFSYRQGKKYRQYR